MTKSGTVPKVLYVELTPEERKAFERLTAESGAAVGCTLTKSAVLRQLIREAVRRGKPVRIQE
jgi:hypothetical protein